MSERNKNLNPFLVDTQITHQQQTAFENIVGKEEIARNEQFLLFLQCFLLNQNTVSPFVNTYDIISLFAAELEEPKIDMWDKGLIFKKVLTLPFLNRSTLIHTVNPESNTFDIETSKENQSTKSPNSGFMNVFFFFFLGGGVYTIPRVFRLFNGDSSQIHGFFFFWFFFLLFLTST